MTEENNEDEILTFKKQLIRMIGPEEYKSLIEIVELSYQFDPKPTYKISYEIE
jgi:hypothetical protein